MHLEIKVNEQKDCAYLIELKGSLDGDTCGELEKKVREIIGDSTKSVILDMGGVNYISSAGIGAIMDIKKSLERKNANFAMENLQPLVKKVFDVMKILPMMDILENIPGADKCVDQIIKEEIERQNK